MKSAIVIGSGVAGLASAIRLSNKGYSVTVFDKNTYPGGKLSEIRSGGFRFDAGPSLFTLPELLDELFIESGKNPSDYYSYRKLEVITKYFFPDETIVSAYGDPLKFAAEMEEKTGEPRSNVLNFLDYSKTIYDLTKFIFLDRSLNKLSTYTQQGTVHTLLNIYKIDAMRTMAKANESKFQTPKAKQLFNRYATYNGSDPYKAPATLNIISHLEHNLGAFFLDKGMHQVTASMYRLANDLGVKFRLGEGVDRIVLKGNRTSGVMVGDEFVGSDVVVSNMDIVPTYRHLMPKARAPKMILDQEKSTSALIFYWGIDRQFDQLDLHNIFFTSDYREEFNQLTEKKLIHNDPTIYLYISSKLCKEDAPEGKENWFVMINVPHIDGQDWDMLISKARASIISKINGVLKCSIEDHIEIEEALDPRSIEQKTSSFKGALYGNSSNNMFSAFLRHPNFSRKIDNLYFCGGSVHPGGGVPLCLSSAKIIDQLV